MRLVEYLMASLNMSICHQKEGKKRSTEHSNFNLQVQALVQQIQNIVKQCLMIHDKLEASLRDLSRTGDVQACKAARKMADGSLKELMKEFKPLLSFLQSYPAAAHILAKVWI